MTGLQWTCVFRTFCPFGVSLLLSHCPGGGDRPACFGSIGPHSPDRRTTSLTHNHSWLVACVLLSGLKNSSDVTWKRHFQIIYTGMFFLCISHISCIMVGLLSPTFFLYIHACEFIVLVACTLLEALFIGAFIRCWWSELIQSNPRFPLVHLT